MAFFRLARSSLSTRLVLLVGIPSALFLAGVIAWLATWEFRRVVQETQIDAQGLARLQTVQVDRVLAEAARIPEMHARALESGALNNEKTLQTYLTQAVAGNNDVIYGSCLAFEPNSYPPARSHFCPYAWWKDGAAAYALLTPPDYDHFQWDWYKLPKEKGHALWTEPFYDEGGGNVLMVTRAVPFKRPAEFSDAGKFWGVATIDISLDQLVASISKIKVAQSGYAFLISPQGRFLAHPDKEKVMRGSLQTDQPELAETMLKQQEGFVRFPDPVTKRDAWIAFASVQNGGFTVALVYPASEIMKPAWQSVTELTAIGVLGVIALLAALFFISRSVTRPITHLAEVARKIAEGDLQQRPNKEVNLKEVRELAYSFDKMTRDLRVRMEELRYATTLKERMAGELNAARHIQMSMLPRQLSATGESMSSKEQITLYAGIQPAREVGGDFYDYRFLDATRLLFLIGDVSGKGVPAALFMAMTLTLVKAHTSEQRAMGEIMARINQAICAEAHTGMFVTLLYGVLDVATGQVELCNGGHSPPLLLNNQGKVVTLETPRNPALGLVSKASYTSVHYTIQPGDRLVCYTDGVTEAFGDDRELYSLDRLKTFLLTLTRVPIKELVTQVMEDVRIYSGNSDLADDLTVLSVGLNPPASVPTNSEAKEAGLP